jgi:hypothetical protein
MSGVATSTTSTIKADVVAWSTNTEIEDLLPKLIENGYCTITVLRELTSS